MVGCRACAARRRWSCGGPRPGEGPGAGGGGREGAVAAAGAWGLLAGHRRGLLRFASPRRVPGRRLGPESRVARPACAGASPDAGPAARAPRPGGQSSGAPRRLGEVPGMRPGGVSSRRCGGREGPGRRGWRPALPAGARRSTRLPGGGVSGPRVGRRDPTPASGESGASGLFVLCCGFVVVVTPLVFSIREERKVCQPFPELPLMQG